MKLVLTMIIVMSGLGFLDLEGQLLFATANLYFQGYPWGVMYGWFAERLHHLIRIALLCLHRVGFYFFII